MEHSPERELKLAADSEFRMPSIYGLGGAAVRHAPPERNATTYYDTDDLRLARWGASLRHRPGEGWTVKLPAERDAPFLVRPEVVFQGNGETPPAAAVALVRGFVRDRELHARVHMTTIRRRTGIHDARGRLMGGVVDDAVSVLDDGSAPASFRELEVEIGDEMTPALLDALVERLRQAGAGAPDQTAKYIRALAAEAPLAPEISVAELGADATAGDVVRRAIALSVIRLVLHDPVVRLDVDPEGVHQARVATRRLRSDLRTFRSLVEPAFASGTRDELGWLAALLGEVRDGDVLLARLRAKAGELHEDDRAGASAVLATLEESRSAAHANLLATLESDRYVELLSLLVDAANAPKLAETAGAPSRRATPTTARMSRTSGNSCARAYSGPVAVTTYLTYGAPWPAGRRGRSRGCALARPIQRKTMETFPCQTNHGLHLLGATALAASSPFAGSARKSTRFSRTGSAAAWAACSRLGSMSARPIGRLP